MTVMAFNIMYTSIVHRSHTQCVLRIPVDSFNIFFYGNAGALLQIYI